MAFSIGNLSVSKGILIASSFTYLIAGIILISLSSTNEPDFAFLTPFLPEAFLKLSLFLIVIGIFNIVTGGFGCWLAITENSRVILSIALKIYLGMLAVFLLVGFVIGYGIHCKAETTVWNEMNGSMAFYDVQKHANIVEAWNEMQHKFECCGTNGPSDWIEVIGGIPLSCCPPSYDTNETMTCMLVPENIVLYKKGCASVLSASVKYFTNKQTIVAVIFFVAQVILIVLLFFVKKSNISKEWKMTNVQHNLGLFEVEKQFYDPRMPSPLKN